MAVHQSMAGSQPAQGQPGSLGEAGKRLLTRSFCFSVRRLLSSSLSYRVTRTFLSQSLMRRGNSVSSESRHGGMSGVQNTRVVSVDPESPCLRANMLAEPLTPRPAFLLQRASISDSAHWPGLPGSQCLHPTRANEIACGGECSASGRV